MPRIRVSGLSSRIRESNAIFALALVFFGTGFCDPIQARIIKFDPPGSTDTTPIAINASGWIIGTYLDSNGGAPQSFLRIPDGTITTIDVPGATCGTYANGINSGGVIVGGMQRKTATTATAMAS
jgi:hypothetical protein